jgi:spermidine dehydrogenase
MASKRKITRRNWLQATTAGSALVAAGAACRNKPAPSKGQNPASSRAVNGGELGPATPAAEHYPPARTGLRGDHAGSFETAHQIRDGVGISELGPIKETGETYDLVVVGGGLSGLAAAYFYRQRVANARILILDNHDDFGGHAKRNEFNVDGRLLLSYGGSQSLANPDGFSDVSKQLMRDLGIDTSVFHKAYNHDLFAKHGTGLFFGSETFGADHLASHVYKTPWPELLANAPLSPEVRSDVIRLYTEKRDYLSGKSPKQKEQLLRKLSYADYLLQHCNVNPDTLRVFQTFPHDLFAVGIDAVSAWSCYHGTDDFGACIYPGFDGLGLPPSQPSEPYIYHFPDGNASVARLLVRALIPSAVQGNSMHDVVLSKVDYSKLDATESAVRLRLHSTVVRAEHHTSKSQPQSAGSAVSTIEVSQPSADVGASVVYSRRGELQRVRGRHVVLACYNAMIPHICPELPEAQKTALRYLVRMPLVYTHVALRNWKPFQQLGLKQIVSPGSYYSFTNLDFPVSLGNYQFPEKPEEPAVLFMLRVPCKPGLSRREQNRMGRRELLQTPPHAYEQHARDQLQRMLAGTEFNAARDIAAITVNRWAHGYAFIPNRLFDPEWAEPERPWVIGRKRWGNFAIANSDAGASAYLDVAVDQAARAVGELLAT